MAVNMLYATLGGLFHDKVTVHNRTTSLMCEEDRKLCSITLKKANAKFSTWVTWYLGSPWYINNTQIVYEEEEVFRKDEWPMRIEVSAANVLDVYCCPKRSGSARVKLGLGSWYKFDGESEFSVTVQCPSQTACETESNLNPTNEEVSSTTTESCTNRKIVSNDTDIKDVSDNSGNSDKSEEASVGTAERCVNRESVADDESEFSITVRCPSQTAHETESNLNPTNKEVSSTTTESCTNRKIVSNDTDIKDVSDNSGNSDKSEEASVGTAERCVNRESVADDTGFKDISGNSDNFSATHSYVRLIPEFDGVNELPLFRCDEHFECLIYLKDGSQNAYATESLSPMDLTVRYYNKDIKDVKIVPLKPGIYQAKVPLQNIRIGDTGKATFTFVFEKNEMPLVLTFIMYNEFNEGSCQEIRNSQKHKVGFRCENVSAAQIKGEDSCNLNNIETVCFEEKHIIVKEINSHVRLILPESCNAEDVKKCRKVLLHLLKGIYYRKKAWETDKKRNIWKEKAIKEFDMGNDVEDSDRNAAADHRKRAAFCKSVKEKYAKLMQRYNDEASKEIFSFFNEELGLNHIDLHGLLVVDEETLAKSKEELLEDKPEEEVANIISERRSKGDEAIRELKTRIDEFMENIEKARREKKTWLEVIVGAGHHSAGGRQKIRPKVEEYLNENYPGKLDVVNKGSLVVTFEEYPNSERCFGRYFCQTCKKDWSSGSSFKNKWQGCYCCYKKGKGVKKCFPLMQCPLAARRQRRQEGGNTKPHLKELCQVCKENGSCKS